MSLNAKKVESAGGGFKQPALEAGTYPARLVQVIDLGVQKQRPYQGQEKDPIQEIYTTYELLDEFMVDEEGNVDETKPRWISERLPFHNLEVDRAKSTLRYLGIDPKVKHDGDWEKLINTPVMITISAKAGTGKHEGKTFNNIMSVAPMRVKEAENAEPLKNDSKFFVVKAPDVDVFMALPEWLQKIIKENEEYKGSVLNRKLADYKKDDSDDRDEGEEQEDNQTDDDDDGDEAW